MVSLLAALLLLAPLRSAADGGAPPGATPAPLAPAAPATAPAASPAGGSGEPSSSCVGEYADDLGALSAAARQFELTRPQFTYCIRTTAVYECPFYGADGSLK